MLLSLFYVNKAVQGGYGSMGMEIERKWLVGRLPEALTQYPFRELTQAYLNFSPAIRVRRERSGDSEHYELTYKGSGAYARREENMPLDRASYESLLRKCEGLVIVKKRYLIPLGAYTAELDVFEGVLRGLCLVEVEFPSEAEGAAFSAPDWFGEDVTASGKYSNAHLARTHFQ